MKNQLSISQPSLKSSILTAPDEPPCSLCAQMWHPSDGSALVLLSPWHRVFEPADWEALLLRSIVPKLAGALQALVINPAAQDMGPFNWVMAWHEVLPPQHMAALLDTGFFPKWHQVGVGCCRPCLALWHLCAWRCCCWLYGFIGCVIAWTRMVVLVRVGMVVSVVLTAASCVGQRAPTGWCQRMQFVLLPLNLCPVHPVHGNPLSKACSPVVKLLCPVHLVRGTRCQTETHQTACQKAAIH